MTKNEFKQGDKVATTKCYDIAINGYSTTIPIGEVGVIEDIDDDELYVYISEYHVYLTLPISEVEPIQPLDRKTAFLTELQALLRKYDAEFSDYENYEVIFNLGEKVSISIDTTDLFNWTNADNLLERATFSDDK